MGRTKSVAFVTSSEWPQLTEDDQLASSALQKLGVSVQPTVWDEPNVEWDSYDSLVFRSCWDYFYKAELFNSWLAELDRKQILTINSLATIVWNFDKRYLQGLESAGVPVIPTEWLKKGCPVDLKQLLRRGGWDRAVVKPAVSGTALHTWICSEQSIRSDQETLNRLLLERDMMVQEFLPEIETTGEWSLIFIAGKFSHAVRKLPRKGDFRVQSEFGGTSHAQDPGVRLIRHCERILKAAGQNETYVRVDGVERADEFLLMEFEALEPALFFSACPSSADIFAQAIVDKLAALTTYEASR